MASSVSFFRLLLEKSLVFPDFATDRGPLDSWGKFKPAANNSIALSTIGARWLAQPMARRSAVPRDTDRGRRIRQAFWC